MSSITTATACQFVWRNAAGIPLTQPQSLHASAHDMMLMMPAMGTFTVTIQQMVEPFFRKLESEVKNKTAMCFGAASAHGIADLFSNSDAMTGQDTKHTTDRSHANLFSHLSLANGAELPSSSFMPPSPMAYNAGANAATVAPSAAAAATTTTPLAIISAVAAVATAAPVATTAPVAATPQVTPPVPLVLPAASVKPLASASAHAKVQSTTPIDAVLQESYQQALEVCTKQLKCNDPFCVLIHGEWIPINSSIKHPKLNAGTMVCASHLKGFCKNCKCQFRHLLKMRPLTTEQSLAVDKKIVRKLDTSTKTCLLSQIPKQILPKPLPQNLFPKTESSGTTAAAAAAATTTSRDATKPFDAKQKDSKTLDDWQDVKVKPKSKDRKLAATSREVIVGNTLSPIILETILALGLEKGLAERLRPQLISMTSAMRTTYLTGHKEMRSANLHSCDWQLNCDVPKCPRIHGAFESKQDQMFKTKTEQGKATKAQGHVACAFQLVGVCAHYYDGECTYRHYDTLLPLNEHQQYDLASSLLECESLINQARVPRLVSGDGALLFVLKKNLASTQAAPPTFQEVQNEFKSKSFRDALFRHNRFLHDCHVTEQGLNFVSKSVVSIDGRLSLPPHLWLYGKHTVAILPNAPTRALLPVAVIPTQDTKVSAVESRRVSTISNKTVGPPVTQNLSVGAAQNGVFPKLSETSATSAVSSTTLTPVSTLHAGTSESYQNWLAKSYQNLLANETAAALESFYQKQLYPN